MLTALRIKNLALVDEITIELEPGYNVITGETGAGKSILIGALTLVLGQRADRTLIRDGSDICSVEAAFDVGRLEVRVGQLLELNGLEPCVEGQLIIKRSFTASGTNRQFVNGSPTTLNVLVELGEWLVDIHGPHDHQSLLHSARQLAILDSFGRLDPLKQRFAESVRRRMELSAQKADLIVDERVYFQQLELFRFQAREIANARLEPEEDIRTEQAHARASNAARLLELSQAASELLSESETCLFSQAGALGRTLQELQRLDASAAALFQMHEQAVTLLRELGASVARFAEQVEVDPARLQQLEERLNLVQTLKRKYGPSLAEVVAFGEEAGRKVATLEQRDAELTRLNAEIQATEGEIWSAGLELSAKRHKIIPSLSKAVSQQLADLGFKQSRFEIALAAQDEIEFKRQINHLSLHGLDTLEFQFAPNPGEAIRPLRSIASSGELARVMLALKTVLATEDQVPVLVFDEVDANVGGEIANTVGDKMQQLAKKRQVLCITHLPQVAATASAHFLVSKEVRAGRTISRIEILERKQRVTELARMLGGQTEPARKHAEALLGLD